MELDQNHYDLVKFLESHELIKKGKGGPVQTTPEASKARREGMTILLPLERKVLFLADKIMTDVEVWAQKRGLERFGMLDPGDCLLLLIGLRKPTAE